MAAASACVLRDLKLPRGERAVCLRAHLDIADCFDTIDHAQLLEVFSLHVRDPALLGLLGQLLDAGGRTVRGWWRTARVASSKAAGSRPCFAISTWMRWTSD